MKKQIQDLLDKVDFKRISDQRKTELAILSTKIQDNLNQSKPINLVFICTHNSRRSQLTQIWAKVAVSYFNIDANTFSGGTEVTAFNENAVESLKRFGFEINSQGTENPKFTVLYNNHLEPITAFSKHYNDCKAENLIAVMTCSNADDNCPFIENAESRIALKYNDPKHFDDSIIKASMYDATSFTIAEEMMWVFSQLKV
jgi:arsenate reductase